METALNITFILVTTVILTAISMKMLHIFQLSSYRIRGVVNWLKVSHYDYLLRYIAYAFFSGGITLLFNFAFPQENVHYFSFLFFVLFGCVFCILGFTRKAKVPLVVTSRMRRLILVNAVVCSGLAVGAWALSLTPVKEASYSLITALVPLACLISYGITYPFEKLIAKSFIKDATEEIDKLKEQGLKVVGITGSYGKTTAKNVLFAMLSTKYRVCATPASYNTPLGICRTVNDTLEEGDEIFIAEMGARRRGDIKELCEVAKPDAGIITGVGNQHFETFGSLEAIADTKYELVEALKDGYAVFNCADEGAKKLSKRKYSNKVTAGAEGNDVVFSDVSVGPFGSKFKLTCGNETVNVKTKLLGSHIPALIATCAGLALKMDVPLCACAKSCEKLAPIPHRLELLKSGDMTIIDDAYNSNTAGAKNALETLASFDGKKIIVTPGIVELGSLESSANEEFGRQIAEVCDLAIFVGSRAKHLTAGAIKGGMTVDRIVCVNSLKEAQNYLAGVSEKATVLFENDLPDNY
ncbi:MAG: hypothetical protein IJX05_00270 [Clostridia bacterium]|nr:hypothetical protein [Clostridia bacterium]